MVTRRIAGRCDAPDPDRRAGDARGLDEPARTVRLWCAGGGRRGPLVPLGIASLSPSGAHVREAERGRRPASWQRGSGILYHYANHPLGEATHPPRVAWRGLVTKTDQGRDAAPRERIRRLSPV